MGIGQRIQDGLGNAIAVVNILRTALAGDNDVEAQVDDADTGDIGEDEYEFSEMWTVAGVQSRPKAGSESAGYAKAIRVQVGDVVYVLGTHDPRHVEACAEGELVMHALGKDGTLRAKATFKPDGTVVIDGDKIELGAGATLGVARITDETSVTIPANTFLISADAGVLNPTPVVVDGVIVTGSSKVKAVD